MAEGHGFWHYASMFHVACSPAKVEAWYVMLGKQFVGMMPFMLIIAAVLSGVTEDWTDFAVITLMLIVNVPRCPAWHWHGGRSRCVNIRRNAMLLR